MIALNLFPFHSPFGQSLTFFDLLMFSIGSFVMISILLSYYNRIPKSKITKDELNNPIYHSSDVLLQSKSNETNFQIAKKTTSTFVKIIVFILVLYILFNPLNESLNFDLY